MANMRVIVQYAVPVFTGILGLLWLFGRKKGKKRSIKDVDREKESVKISTSVIQSKTEETKVKEIEEHKEDKSLDSKPEIVEKQIPGNIVDLKSVCTDKANSVPSSNKGPSSLSSPDKAKVESEDKGAKSAPRLIPTKAASVYTEHRATVSEENLKTKVSVVNKPVSSDTETSQGSSLTSDLKDDTPSEAVVQSTGEQSKLQGESLSKTTSTPTTSTTNTTTITTTTTQSATNNVSTQNVSSRSPKKSGLSKKLSEIDNGTVAEVQDCVQNSWIPSQEIPATVNKDTKSLPISNNHSTPVASEDNVSKNGAARVKDNQCISESRDSISVKDTSSASSSLGGFDQENSVPIVVETMESQTSQVCRTQQVPKEVEPMQACAKSPESHPTTADVSPVSSESPGCDSNSEASNDSGRGGSVTENLSSMCSPEIVRFEFNFPSELCGRLIGKQGKNINAVKEQSGANVALQNNPYTPEFQICVVEGTQGDVERALSLIRHKFPRSQFSQLDMNPINQPVPPRPAHPVLMPNIMQLSLPEGVSVDVVVSSIVDAGHVFVQQPTHPSFPSLERLDQYMMMCYTQDNMVPPLPHPIEVGVICVAPAMDGFYRAEIVQVHEDTNECDIKFVDYGGYERVPTPHLKQIRSDFMTLPFQAVECYIYNITPLPGEEYFSDKAASVLEELTQGQLLQAQVINRADDGVPYIHIYQINGDRVIFINRELVNRKVTRGIEIIQ